MELVTRHKHGALAVITRAGHLSLGQSGFDGEAERL